MKYKVGMKVCLWQEKVEFGKDIVVLKEVIVTIAETKTGVPGEFSREPVSGTSLRGIGDDGKEYFKHWDSWPESQTNCFTSQWSMRDDGEGDFKHWIPKEAIHAYNEFKRAQKDHPNIAEFKRVDTNGQPILPKGDIVYCDKHDDYHYPESECIWCRIERRKAEQAA